MEYKGFGIGCMNMTAGNQSESTEVIHAAVNAGVTFLDTADFYSGGESEMAVGRAIKGIRREDLYISVKFGSLNSPDGMLYGLDVHPSHVRNYLTRSLRRLGVDYIDLYQPCRIDMGIPVEETVGAVKELVEQGYVRHIGLSQIDADTLDRACAVHEIQSVEMEYSLFNRGIESELIPAARRHGTGIVAFGIIAHGLLSGSWTRERIESGDYPVSVMSSLFEKGNIEKNVVLAENLLAIAKEKKVTLSQLAHAWALAKGQDIIPLIGASKPEHFADSLKAREITLSQEDMRRIEDAVPADAIAGDSFRNIRFMNGKVVFPA